MAINKVEYGNNTLIDITDTTATENDVASGKDFYLANGVKATGTAPTNVILSDTIRTIVTLTQIEYNALSTKDSETLYVIVG